MADMFKVRIVAKPDEKRKEDFKELVKILADARDNENLDLGDLCEGLFRSRDYAVNAENITAEDDLIAFDAEVAYGIFEEGKIDLARSYGVGELRMLYAHERPRLDDWEDNDEEYKTIGMLKVKIDWKKDEYGDWSSEDCDISHEYPPEDDEIKIAQWWQLAWAGCEPVGYDFEDFFGQLDSDVAGKAMKGITLLEYDGDEEGTPLWEYPEKVVGFSPLGDGARFLGDEKNWWRR